MVIFGISPIHHFWINIMALTLQLDAIDTLRRTPVSDVKKLGWRGVVKAMQREGKSTLVRSLLTMPQTPTRAGTWFKASTRASTRIGLVT